jgi:tetratricopeptide (TPR) repeat protein
MTQKIHYNGEIDTPDRSEELIAAFRATGCLPTTIITILYLAISSTPSHFLALLPFLSVVLVTAMMFESDSSEEDEEIAPSTSLLGESLPYVGTSAGEVAYKSAEFVEAKCSIAKNPYDKNSWKVMLEEAEKSENKSLILDSFCNATTQFPRAASLLRRYVHFLTRYGETKLADDVFRKCLTKCRSVELWDQYLVFVRSKTIDNHPPTSDHYTNTKKTYETAFENALENVGLSLDVNIIWRKYIDFVLEWPDTKEVDSGRKLTALRELYQRAVSCPMDHLDSFWREYEEWEMKSGKHLAEQLLPEFKRKYQDARNIYKDRKKLYAGIDMLHIAAPPTMEGSIVEMKQLELWNNLIKCEVKTLIDSTEAQRKALINFLFDRFLTCFYFHPEAWIMLSQCQLQFFTSTDARNTLKESILVIPNVPTLWLNLAELEESDGDVESAEDILRLCFEQVPSSFTFAIFQKFIRRKDGKVAARKFFSDTVLLREEGVLGLETYVAHAALELEVNNEPACALRILELARDKYPTAYSSVVFVKVLTKVLVRLGDYRQLRWVYEAKIGLLEDNNSLVKKQSKNSSMFNNADEQSLLEDLLEAEIIMGMCDTKRLLMLQERVSRVKVDSAKVSHSLVSKIDLFEPTHQFFIR